MNKTMSIDNSDSFQAAMLQMNFASDNDFMSNRKVAKWGTYGKTGRSPLRFIRVCDMTNEHLEAIVSQRLYEEFPITQLFIKELDYRKMNGIIINDNSAPTN